ncbi:unnamed protein product [Clonostachys byssicola]|uniref:Uncharacterized protein n=1 Tax=Clonostachys byssicola TaxID=160290 RepID=A0A9N9V1J4_9HYPO|nr:unnamed protein product [Clonostachys byssicola]
MAMDPTTEQQPDPSAVQADAIGSRACFVVDGWVQGLRRLPVLGLAAAVEVVVEPSWPVLAGRGYFPSG